MTPAALFSSFAPEADALLRLISHHVDDAMLEEIPAAEYGYDVEKHLLHLRRIRDEGTLAAPMRWEPREVLELIRWSEPEDPAWKPGGLGQRGHWMRAFACVALLRAAADAENWELRQGSNETLIQLADSVRVLDPELYEPAAAFMAWLILIFEPDQETEELGFFGVGLLWFALHLRVPVSDEVIVALAEWIVAREQTAKERGPGFEGWLVGTTFFNQKQAKWRNLGTALERLDLRSRSAVARDWVQLIGGELAGEA